ncbi:hypothetical protein KUCAC02_026858, partial [Chaenocephalus aceratus]
GRELRKALKEADDQLERERLLRIQRKLESRLKESQEEKEALQRNGEELMKCLLLNEKRRERRYNTQFREKVVGSGTHPNFVTLWYNKLTGT